jgi:pimeloyl-ACP methyl ester carboxylesterase
VILFGHSFGGQLSIRIAAAHPDRVEKVVLLNSAGIKRQLSAQEQRKFGMIGTLRNGVKWLDSTFGLKLFENWFIPRFGSDDYKKAGALRPVLVKGISQDLSEQARAIAAPTLLIWGEKDTATPLEIGQRLERMIKSSRLVVLNGRGHIPFQGSGAHLCAYHMLPFLKGEEARV